MTPAKGNGSSCWKGKEVATDDPATKTIAEDAPLSKSKRSKQEEVGRNPNSKCAPLIDPWYDTHMYFLVVPGEYLPSLSGRV